MAEDFLVFSTMYTQINAQMVEIVHNENLMSYSRTGFVPFSPDSGRVAANLEAAYVQWLDTRQQLVKIFTQAHGYNEI